MVEVPWLYHLVGDDIIWLYIPLSLEFLPLFLKTIHLTIGKTLAKHPDFWWTVKVMKRSRNRVIQLLHGLVDVFDAISKPWFRAPPTHPTHGSWVNTGSRSVPKSGAPMRLRRKQRVPTIWGTCILYIYILFYYIYLHFKIYNRSLG